MSESTLSSVEGAAVLLLLVSYVLWFALARLRRTRPEFRIGRPVAVGVLLRLAAVVGIANSGLQTQLRGGDEQTFLTFAHIVADAPLGSIWLPHAAFKLPVITFAAQLKIAHVSADSLRITQVGIATLGSILILAAVHDLRGPRAARFAAWLLAIEPASIFFSSALHKEPLMMLATGLVVFGGTKLWRSLNPYGILICAIGCLIAVYTRSYAGWFLVSASVLVLLHAALKRMAQRPGKAMPVIYAVVLAGFLVFPTLTSVTSNKNLTKLQESQTANSTGAGQGQKGAANGSNLALEQVDFSNRGAVIRNLPQRMYDVTFRPYPWQLQNPSQQLGAVGTLISTVTLVFVLRYAWRRRGKTMDAVGPLFYPFLFLLFAYALSAGNAGTGFRYRTHLVGLMLAMLALLREPAPETSRVRQDLPIHTADASGAGTVALDWLDASRRVRA